MNISRIVMILSLIAMSVVYLSCEEIPPPPKPMPDTYIKSGPQDGSVVTEPSVTFIVDGSDSLVSEFSYKLMPGQDNWSQWSTNKSIKLDYLDQGKYTFQVKGRYDPSSEDESPAQRIFTVDIPGPAIIMKPLKQNVRLGQEFKLDVQAVGVKDLAFAHLVLKVDPARFRFIDVIPGAIFQASSPPTLFKSVDNTQGLADISIGFFNARPARIEGTEAIATAKLLPLSIGNSNVSFGIAEFRDSEGKLMKVLSMFGSAIEISQ